MPVPIGHMMIQDLASGQAANQIVVNFGIENAMQGVQAELDAHNAIVNELIGEIASPATARMESHGGGAGRMKMFKAAEHSRVPTQKVAGAYNLGYPIFKNQHALGWTDEWFRRKTMQELAMQVAARRLAHLLTVYSDLRKALMLSANFTHEDEWEDPPLSIPVKRLVNADGQPINPNANGVAFDGATHSHYLASATLTNAVALSAIGTVLEHQATPGLRVAIASTDRADWEALTEFRGFTVPNTVPTPGESTVVGDPTRTDNVPIGTIGAATVWVKPWGVDNYPIIYDPARPPLRYRERQGVGLQGLFIAAQNRAFPWLAEYAEAYYGFGVGDRTAAAVLFIGGGAYVDPTGL